MTTFNSSLLLLVGIVIAGPGCATRHTVESQAVTAALDFDKTSNFTVDVQNTATIDTAFSKELREETTKLLIDELELKGFNYVGHKNPSLRIRFSTYVTDARGYVDTSLPIQRRVVKEVTDFNPPNKYHPNTKIITETTTEPIYLSGDSRVFSLDVVDTDSEVILWRAYTIDESTGLDSETLAYVIDKLVDRLAEET